MICICNMTSCKLMLWYAYKMANIIYTILIANSMEFIDKISINLHFDFDMCRAACISFYHFSFCIWIYVKWSLVKWLRHVPVKPNCCLRAENYSVPMTAMTRSTWELVYPASQEYYVIHELSGYHQSTAATHSWNEICTHILCTHSSSIQSKLASLLMIKLLKFCSIPTIAKILKMSK